MKRNQIMMIGNAYLLKMCWASPSSYHFFFCLRGDMAVKKCLVGCLSKQATMCLYFCRVS